MTSLPEERRAIMRIDAVWQRIAGEGLPKRSQIDPTAFGTDWSHCLFIDLKVWNPKAAFRLSGEWLPRARLPEL